MNTITLNAPAKINWFLEIEGKRPDGYHEISTVFQTLELADRVTLTKTEKPGFVVETDSDEIPTDGNNIAVRAAERLFRKYHLDGRLKIRLEKNIPVRAGLGGGSSDAAAVLLGVSRLYDLDLPEETLVRTGADLGADVPFFFEGGTAFGSGIGEWLIPLSDTGSVDLLLVKPEEGVSTKEIYEEYDLSPVARMEKRRIPAYFTDRKKNSVIALSAALYIAFEPVTEKKVPAIAAIRASLLKNGAIGALMSGSGSTVFGVFKTARRAEKAAQALRKTFPGAWICRTAASPSGIMEE